jgi:SAM-dependent methyltransferase
VTVDRLRRDWDELAADDALWAVLADPGRSGGRWTLEEFLRTGEEEVETTLATAASLGLPARHERALDFGCGVGRLTRALAARFGEAVGVDVSPEMVARAEKLNRDRPNCGFLVNTAADLRLFGDAAFDFTYSSKVLQHMPSRELALAYIAELLRVTRPDGLAVFQVWSYLPWRNRLQPRRRAYGVLRALRLPRHWLSRVGLTARGRGIAVPRADVERLVERSGRRLVHAEPDGEWGFRYFVCRRERGANA